jgi:CubicO group peptidase (beta-lactamase class C family)
MDALRLTASWPVAHVAAAAVLPTGNVATFGDDHRPFALASISKVLTGWATLIAVEEGLLGLDEPVGQPGCTLRHLLAHAGGYPFDGREPIARPETRRIYSNTGIEMAAAAVVDAAAMPFEQYLREAVFEPLGMTSSVLRGSAAHGVTSTVADLVRFIHELSAPRLLSAATATDAVTTQYPELAGMVPGFGRFRPCPWGLGIEIRGDKQPHWTGSANSPDTCGHFGGAGTLLWMDPRSKVSCVALTDRPFEDWADQARQLWPALADAVLAEALG